MTIRRASFADIDTIMDIADSVAVDRNSQMASGFVEYHLGKEDYKRRMDGDLVFLTYEKQALGFLLAYSSDFLRQLTQIDERVASDEIVARVLELPKPFVYVDQIAVLPWFRRKGIATRLIESLEDEMRKRYIETLYSAISHTPWRNEGSVTLATKLGHRCREDVATHSGLTFGIYEKML